MLPTDYATTMSPDKLRIPGFGWTQISENDPLAIAEAGLQERRVSLPAKLNESPNVILLYRLQSLRTMSDTNFFLAVLTLIYVGINTVMIVLNYLDNENGDCSDPDDVRIARCGSPVSPYTFHMIEFTATFIFAVIQAFALLYTPKSLLNIYDNPFTLKLVLFFAIVVSFVPTLLVWCNLERFEIPSHEVEYGNELTMSFVDLVLLGSLVRQQLDEDGVVVAESPYPTSRSTSPTRKSLSPARKASEIAMAAAAAPPGKGPSAGYGSIGDDDSGHLRSSLEVDQTLQEKGELRGPSLTSTESFSLGNEPSVSVARDALRGMCQAEGSGSLLMVVVAALIAVTQMFIYNGLGTTASGDKVGERLAHYCEFAFEIISALITFWFCVDNKFLADREIDQIMYGDHRDCAVCHSKSIEMTSLATSSASQVPCGSTTKTCRNKKCGHQNFN
mmetsp:Transcript_15376/g.30833  ORF Transcript_15376/g.30833 Transcript_15376/m.30833 type:complete len:446 (+) Transcript_15376:46-1383(+)